jgi:N-acetylneuraminic acid mutarotase
LKYYSSLFIFFTCFSASAQWVRLTDFPSTERDDGVCFVIGNKAYAGTGLKTWWIPCSDFYALDMNNDTWSIIDSLPAGTERQYATAFSYNGVGFIFGGLNGSTYMNDLWMYDTLTGHWQSKTSMPGAGRMGSCSFVLQDTAYIIGGRTSAQSSISEVWAYSIANDIWVIKDSLPFGARWRASIASGNGKGYLMFGQDESGTNHRELYEFNPASNAWTEISVFPGSGRVYAAMRFFNGQLVTLCGLNSAQNSYNDFWHFDFSSSSWHVLDSLPSVARRGGMCFNNSNAVYYTTGIDQTNNRLNETWMIANPIGITEKTSIGKINIYPNPARGKVYFQSPSRIQSVSIYDISGKEIKRRHDLADDGMLNIEELAEGSYFFKIECTDTIAIQMVIVLK